MGKKKHLSWDFKKDFHKGDKPGCIWRHASGWGHSACHYAMNSFDVSAGRTDMYNKDHRSVAKALGYLVETADKRFLGGLRLTSRIQQEVGAKTRSAGRDASFRDSYQRRFMDSMRWLRLHPEGWHYGHLLDPANRPKVGQDRDPQPTFKVRDEDRQGYGFWYPYHHNHHHMIPQGALQEYVIGEDDKARRRVEIICSSKWNINGPLNMVILPQEIAVSKIVGLPAHCPWGLKKHASYSKSMKDKLTEVKRKLDKALMTSACEDIDEVVIELDSTSKSILEQIKTMQPGRQIGRVK